MAVASELAKRRQQDEQCAILSDKKRERPKQRASDPRTWKFGRASRCVDISRKPCNSNHGRAHRSQDREIDSNPSRFLHPRGRNNANARRLPPPTHQLRVYPYPQTVFRSFLPSESIRNARSSASSRSNCWALRGGFDPASGIVLILMVLAVVLLFFFQGEKNGRRSAYAWVMWQQPSLFQPCFFKS